MSQPMQITFDLNSSTPGTFKFKERGEPAYHKVGMLYIKKNAAKTYFGDQPPATITVVVHIGG